MTWARQRWRPLAVLVAAAALLAGSVAWAVSLGTGDGPDGWGPGGMGGSRVWISGDGPVDDLDEARSAADRFAQRWGLSVGEVMAFDNGYYAELAEPSGSLATEVLVDPDSGAVRLEYGPAMMWNTAFGMHRVDEPVENVDAAQARTIADAWLADHRPGESASTADAFPGYYTVHTEDDGEVSGMLSVNASTGAVWFHSWHGDFLEMAEGEEE